MPEHPPTQLFAAAGNALQKAFSSKKTCPAWMEAIVKGVVVDVVNKKLNGAFSELNGAASAFQKKTKFKWDGLNVLSSNKKNYGVYLQNSGVKLVQSYKHKFRGRCSNGREIGLYTGEETNGLSHKEKLVKCATSCLVKTPTIQGSWKGFVAKGFVVDPSGRCYCQSANSTTCARDVNNTFERYDFNDDACAPEDSSPREQPFRQNEWIPGGALGGELWKIGSDGLPYALVGTAPTALKFPHGVPACRDSSCCKSRNVQDNVCELLGETDFCKTKGACTPVSDAFSSSKFTTPQLQQIVADMFRHDKQLSLLSLARQVVPLRPPAKRRAVQRKFMQIVRGAASAPRTADALRCMWWGDKKWNVVVAGTNSVYTRTGINAEWTATGTKHNGKCPSTMVSRQCTDLLKNNFAIGNDDVQVADDCKTVKVHLGLPVTMRDTFTAGAVLPNPELFIADKNCGIEVKNAAVALGCSTAKRAGPIAARTGCIGGCGVADAFKGFNIACAAMPWRWGDHDRCVKELKDDCLNGCKKDHTIPPVCEVEKVEGKEKNYWCNKRVSLPKTIFPEVSIRPSVSAILDMDISVDLKTQKPSISGKTVTLSSRCATEGAGTYERQLTQACEDNLAQINPLLKQQIKNALVI